MVAKTAAEIIFDPAAFLRAIRSGEAVAVPDFNYAAAAALRDAALAEEKAAESYRDAQAQKLLDLFKEAHGREATSVEELSAWATSPAGKAVLARHHDKDGKIIP